MRSARWGAAAWLAVFAVEAMAQALCPASAVTAPGIGDGCSSQYGDYRLANVQLFPTYTGLLTPACNAHDRCYTTLGNSGAQCNSAFAAESRAACAPLMASPSQYYAECTVAASLYSQAFDRYLSDMNPVPGYQAAALALSRQTEARVKADTCLTTPERTTLYSAGLMAKVRQVFSSHTGRQPTIYEFLEMVNFGDLVQDPVAWDNSLAAYALQKVHAPQPPVVDWRLDGKSIVATPLQPGVTYLWNLDNFGLKEGPAVLVGGGLSMYDHWRTVRGYVKATANKGTSLEVSNVVLVDTKVFIRGWCSSGPSQQCR